MSIETDGMLLDIDMVFKTTSKPTNGKNIERK